MKWSHRLFAFAAAFTLALPAIAAQPDADPVYEGKKASQWVSVLQTDTSARKRALAAVTVGQLWTKHQYSDALTNLGRSLRIDSSVAVRTQCATVIARLKPADAARIETDILDTLKNEKDSRVRTAIATLLGRFPEIAKNAVEPLTAVLKDPDPAARAAAADALARVGHAAKAAGPALLPLLNDPDRTTRQTAIFALGRIGPDNASFVAAALVKRYGEEKEAELRREIVLSLKLLGDKSEPVVNGLAAALADPDPDTQATAAAALGTFGPAALPAADDLLKVMTAGKNKGVRIDAVRAFGSALGPKLKDRLTDLYPRLEPQTEPDFEVRLAIVEEIAALGPAIKDDSAAMAALRKRRSDPQVKVREAAAAAIRRVEKKPEEPATKKPG